MRRGRCADAYENGRNRPPGVNRRRRISEADTEETNNLVPELGQGLGGVAREFAIWKEIQQSRSEREFLYRSDGANGFAYDEIVRIAEERVEQGIEGIWDLAEEAREFQTGALAVFAALACHF